MRKVTLAATQMTCSWEIDDNVAKAERLIREAAGRGASIILIQELFETPYFCIDQDMKYLNLAKPMDRHTTITHMQGLARELNVVLPVSFFERANQAFYNSVAMVDADGALLGVYRKTHIPNAVGYQEKQYFNPGDTGFKVWDTRFGFVGVGICWDQWFPETARCMALMGAELLMFPTAIGTDDIAGVDSTKHWQLVMQGHAAANIVPVVASNRIGTEKGKDFEQTYFGSSFITDHTGRKITEANKTDETVLTAMVDLDEIREYREFWNLFRDRRPEHYGPIMTLDGKTRAFG